MQSQRNKIYQNTLITVLGTPQSIFAFKRRKHKNQKIVVVTNGFYQEGLILR